MIYYLIILITYIVLRAYQGVMLLSIFISWIPGARDTKLGILINRTSDWYLGYFGNFLVFGGIDFTPMLGLFIYEIIINLIWL